eukprot:SAG31_NODE_24830_length_473_cov_1.245989_1_plen_39_part_10
MSGPPNYDAQLVLNVGDLRNVHFRKVICVGLLKYVDPHL